MSRACPRCSAELTRFALADVEAESCAACSGVFLAPLALSHFATDHNACVRAANELPALEYHVDLNVRYLPCPFCSTRMNHKLYGRLSHVVVDICREHGVWFDKGGLPTVLRFVADGGLERARKRDLEDAAEAARAARVRVARDRMMAAMSESGSLASQTLALRAKRDLDMLDALKLLFHALGLGHRAADRDEVELGASRAGRSDLGAISSRDSKMSDPGPTLGRNVDPAHEPPKPGDVLAGKYRVESVLGAGGMGVVLLVQHVELGQRMAVKLLLPGMIPDATATARFLREARAAASLQSEHVVRIFDVGTLDDEAPYMVMELLRGKDLAQVLARQGRLEIADAVEYVSQACHAIGEAHRLGIVHRDLKPSNLFLSRRSDGTPLVKVLDFGISKASNADAESPFSGNLTATSAVMGSPLYMSPEQVRDAKQVDTRADIWSLGVILHELLTGRPAFHATTLPGVCAAIICDEPPPLRSLREEAPEELELVVARCLSKGVDTRFQTTRELVDALRPFTPNKGNRAQVEDTMRPPPSQVAPLSEQAVTSADATLQSNLTPPSGRVPSKSGPVSVGKAASWRMPRATESAGSISVAMANASITKPGVSATIASNTNPVAPAPKPFPVAIIGGVLAVAVVAAIFFLGRSSNNNAPTAPAVAASAAPPTAATGKKSFLLLIESMPSGADVVEGEKVLGTTPVQLSVDNESARNDARKISVRRAGYQSYSIVQGSSDDNVRVVATLIALPPDATPAPTASADATSKTSKPAPVGKAPVSPATPPTVVPPSTPTPPVTPPPTQPGDIRLNR